MPENVFQVFMASHQPISELVTNADDVLWNRSALPVRVKERLRIAAAEAIGCSYCARFRTDGGSGAPIAEEDLSPEEKAKSEFANRFVTALVRGEESDELTGEAQKIFSPAEFTDLVFSCGWFIGMQHVGRLMHWDNACPVAPIREMVEAGAAA
ncbi:MAG: carboxymuconolactone decarboxylase family protein [Actinobacteria bacterium]|nr:carboxymuconolactone decarboxylase family protein [Actinomycetota bacterium]MBS1882952.1 carboxymuconolactone decarboxylase family protein [Actinomycetota bacterium]